MTKMTIDQAIQIAFRHHQAGRTAEAETICRQVLIQAPDHAHALHLLGVLSGHAGHNEAAIELIGRVIAINPAVAQYQCNLGESYWRAKALWEEAFIQFPPTRSNWHLTWPWPTTASASSSGTRAESTRLSTPSLERSRLRPDYPEAHNNLGIALKDQGQINVGDRSLHRFPPKAPIPEAHPTWATP